MQAPSFHSHLQIVAVGTNKLFVVSQDTELTLTGGIYVDLAKWLTGKHTIEQILDAEGFRERPEETLAALSELRNKGLIDEGTVDLDRPERAFWNACGASNAEISAGLRRGVRSWSRGNVSEDAFLDACSALGIPIKADADLDVILTDDYLDAYLETWNEQALAKKRPWMLVQPLGYVVAIGPLLRPGVTACYQCLAMRLRAHQWLRTSLEAQAGFAFPNVVQAGLATTVSAASHLAATEAAKWLILGENATIEGRIATVDLRTLTVARHDVERLPFCEACGNHRRALTGLGRSAKADVERIVSPLTGIVKEVRFHESTGFPEFVLAVSRHILPLSWERGERYAVAEPAWAFGGGFSREEAGARSLAEAVEHYSLCFTGREPLRLARPDELSPRLLPDALHHFSAAQFAARDEYNARAAAKHWIPETFPAGGATGWVKLTALGHEESIWAPAAHCYFLYPFRGEQFLRSTSNGCAAGECAEDAIFRGVCELLERDAVALWWYNRVRRPAFDLDTIESPELNVLLAGLASLGRSLKVLDLNTELGVHVAAAVSAGAGGTGILMGFGAHPDSRKACVQAVRELVQRYIWEYEWTDGRPEQEASLRQWLEQATLADCSYLVPRGLAEHGAPRAVDNREYTRQITGKLAAAGMRLWVLDQTAEDIRYPVWRAIIPEMRSFSAAFGPGRLYDEPVRLGWTDRVLSESELNPTPFPL